MTLLRYNPRQDGNATELIATLRACGCRVTVISGTGLPDLVIGHRGRLAFVELKMRTGKLRQKQELFRDQCHVDRLPWFLLRATADIPALLESLASWNTTPRGEEL